MHTVTSFHASAVEPGDLRGITADYVALERARVLRRLLVVRFGLLAIVTAIIGLGFRWLSALAFWSSLGVCLAVPAIAWIVELRRGWTLAHRLQKVPGGVTRIVK